MTGTQQPAWLEEIRRYWQSQGIVTLDECAAIVGCAQRAVSQAILGLDDRAGRKTGERTELS